MKNTIITIAYKGGRGKNALAKYTHVSAIKAGPARQVLGEDDARGNGIPLNAPLLQVIMENGDTATYDADHVTILL